MNNSFSNSHDIIENEIVESHNKLLEINSDTEDSYISVRDNESKTKKSFTKILKLIYY